MRSTAVPADTLRRRAVSYLSTKLPETGITLTDMRQVDVGKIEWAFKKLSGYQLAGYLAKLARKASKTRR